MAKDTISLAEVSARDATLEVAAHGATLVAPPRADPLRKR